MSKTTKPLCPEYRYIYALLSNTLTRRENNTGVVEWLDISYLHSMIMGEPLYLRYAVVDYLRTRSTARCTSAST